MVIHSETPQSAVTKQYTVGLRDIATGTSAGCSDQSYLDSGTKVQPVMIAKKIQSQEILVITTSLWNEICEVAMRPLHVAHCFQRILLAVKEERGFLSDNGKTGPPASTSHR